MSWSLNAGEPLLLFPILPPGKFCKQAGSPGDTNKQRYLHHLLCDEDMHVSTILLASEYPVRYRVPYSSLLCHHTTVPVNCELTLEVLMKRLTRI